MPPFFPTPPVKLHKLHEIHPEKKTIHQQNPSTQGLLQPLMLGIHRSDYMLHESLEEKVPPRFLQVELNTIASSMGAHASNVPLDNVGREGNGKVDFVVLVSIILVGNILIFIVGDDYSYTDYWSDYWLSIGWVIWFWCARFNRIGCQWFWFTSVSLWHDLTNRPTPHAKKRTKDAPLFLQTINPQSSTLHWKNHKYSPSRTLSTNLKLQIDTWIFAWENVTWFQGSGIYLCNDLLILTQGFFHDRFDHSSVKITWQGQGSLQSPNNWVVHIIYIYIYILIHT